ncbi:MAG: hypothetical protein CVU38_06920 [Chloroflexi bacterium HGW-Chloroflexi-1]|nr:MAG: hypothetical protein CVU38_06920 [Chloroflexi bacterium HGW-Chloroflexi-1]
MDLKDIQSELIYRLQCDLNYFDGRLPRDYAIAWRAYFAALLEWGVISVSVHYALGSLLPEIEDDPVEMIMLGREEADAGDKAAGS